MSKCEHVHQIVLQEFNIMNAVALAEIYDTTKDWGLPQRDGTPYVSATVALHFCVDCGRIRGDVTGAYTRS